MATIARGLSPGDALSAVGVLALVVLALLATPLERPAELQSISRARGTVDLSSLPAIERFQARDGSWLGFRHYGAGGTPAGRIAIVIHGSSGSSGGTIHALSQALSARGVESYALDLRGHGVSGTRGDIGYLGQLEDDLADFVGVLRQSQPTAPITLVGHSSGGAFALRVASSPIANLFERTVLLAPYLGYDAPTTRPNSGGWAKADVPRPRAAGNACRRHRLLRRLAGARLCGAAELGEAANRDLHRSAVPTAQLRCATGAATLLAAVSRPLTC
jgi:pimeloyl-ACP methyl ester carboxylesterase